MLLKVLAGTDDRKQGGNAGKGGFQIENCYVSALFFCLPDNSQKMIILYVVLTILCFCTSVSSFKHDNTCHFTYDYKCAGKINKHNISYNDQIKLCTMENIPKEVNFDIMLDEKNSSSPGVVNVDFKSPNLQCKYEVALFVNPYINNLKDCKKYQFHKSNYAEIHTFEKTICPMRENETENQERETTQIESSSCKENVLNLWYEYIYTGCYTLGFKVNEDYIFVGNDLLKTEYKKVEVTEPKLRCRYKSSLKENKSSVEMITLEADISFLAGSSGLRLEVAPNSLQYKNEENACNRYNVNPVVVLFLGMSTENETDMADHNCTLKTTSLPSGDLAKTVECNFMIQNSLKDVGYCFLVRIIDDRCHQNTSWKPPLKDKDPCTWIQYCSKTEEKRTGKIEEIKSDDTKILKIPKMFYPILFITIILVVLIVLSAIFIAYRIHIQCTKNSLNTKMKKKDFDDDGSAVLELDNTKLQKEKLVKETGIVILYVRGTEQFMNFMSEFRKSLKQHTGCDVYDWWAPDLWNDVARIGGYEWVVKMIRKDCRVLWIDTLKARRLFAFQRKNGHDKFKQLKYISNSQEISDFRDEVFPAIVNFAKRSNQDLDQEYQRHFVIRLETFDNADRTEDPFADLSPHARYLIPCHFDKLCYQLSICELYFEEEMNMDKIRLGKYLLQDSGVNF